MNKYFLKIKSYFSSAWQELKKTNWPTKKDTIHYTIGVLSLSFFVAIVLGFFDYGLIQLLKIVIGK